MPLSSMEPRWNSGFNFEVGSDAALWAGDSIVTLSDLATGTSLGAAPETLRGRSVLVRTSDQLVAAVALLDLEGLARRIVLAPPDLDPAHLPYVVATAEVDAIVTDREREAFDGLGVECIVPCTHTIRPLAVNRTSHFDTEWILFTSGT